MNFQWIPQFFMDFIGRVIPGAIVLMAGRIVWTGDFDVLNSLVSKGEGGINWALILPLILVCYLVGLFLTQIWNLTIDPVIRRRLERIQDRCREKRLKEHNKLQELLGRPALSFKHGDLPPAFIMHDHLRITLPQEAMRLLKLQSEKRLCHALFIGLLVLCIINGWFLVKQPTFERWLTEILMAGSVFTAWMRTFRLETFFTNGVCVLWFALASTNRLFSSGTQGGSSAENSK